MSRVLLSIVSALLAVPSWGQDAAKPDDKTIRTKINDLSKQLRSSNEETRLQAIGELADIDDAKARSLLSKKLTTDTDKVRIAAAKALAKQRHPVCADSIGKGLQKNLKNDRLVLAYVNSLSDMDMCAGIKVLLMVVQGKPTQGAAALDAIAGIGCTEAVQPLVVFLKKAETEEKKPDFFEPAPAVGVGTTNPLDRARFARGKKIPNKTKDKDVAKLAPKVRETLEKLTSQKHADYKAWFDASRSGKLRKKLVSVYRCPEKGETFQLDTGKRVACPLVTGRSRHKDVLLKHRPE